MSKEVEMHASIKKIFRVISDIEHYRDWSGDGVRSMRIREHAVTHATAEYICGTFGITFKFVMHWSFASPGKCAAENLVTRVEHPATSDQLLPLQRGLPFVSHLQRE